jgi:hypothetical protein
VALSRAAAIFCTEIQTVFAMLWLLSLAIHAETLQAVQAMQDLSTPQSQSLRAFTDSMQLWQLAHY